MDNKEILQRMEAGAFIENNGKVLRAINLIKGKYIKLSQVRFALPTVAYDDVFKSINFLSEEGYMHIRSVETKENANIADFNLEDLEGKLSGKGIRLLCGDIEDRAIDV
ncbi:MAG: type VI secretion protein [Oscillospiraceae bacterium]